MQYTLFTDSDGNGHYTLPTGPTCGDAAQDLECIERYTSQRNIRFSSLLKPGGGSAAEFSVLFRRPDPAMSIHDGATLFSPSAGGSFGPFKIFVQSSDGSIEKEVDVWLTGQISIK
ncbi:MAG: hypothetical protein HYT34_01230 [Candidatus Ryanbacteria bacterium]|nr:hypothetical protein [Candidatus Ryanbacteria bacterium]